MYTCSDEDIASLGIHYRPDSLDCAIDALAADPLARRVFGDLMFDAFVESKREQWASCHDHVSDQETERYLKFFRVCSSLRADLACCLHERA